MGDAEKIFENNPASCPACAEMHVNTFLDVKYAAVAVFVADGRALRAPPTIP